MCPLEGAKDQGVDTVLDNWLLGGTSNRHANALFVLVSNIPPSLYSSLTPVQ